MLGRRRSDEEACFGAASQRRSRETAVAAGLSRDEFVYCPETGGVDGSRTNLFGDHRHKILSCNATLSRTRAVHDLALARDLAKAKQEGAKL